jgi:hypothetical protein
MGPMFDATPLLKLYARRRLRVLSRMEPAAAQRAQLAALLRAAAGTGFGRDHGFARIRSPAAFRAAVPLRSYAEFWRAYWQPAFPRLDGVSWPGVIPFFALTSGTTGDATKYIPVSAAMLRANRKAALDLLVHHVAGRPRSRVLGGLNFMLGGSTDLDERAPGVFSGDLSGIAAKTIPWWARTRSFPPLRLALLADWEEKVRRLAEAGVQRDIRSVGGTPSWLLILFDRMAALRGGARRPLRTVWPGLELVVHGGVNFAPYRSRFEALLAGSHAELREVYAASEGFIAGADRGAGEGLRLNLDHGLFYEFVPVEELGAAAPTRHWIGDAEPGVNYALAVSTCAGLWAYLVGDTVRLVSRDPARVLVTGRTAYGLSAFGEHLIGEEIEGAVAHAAAATGTTVAEYSVGAVFPETPSVPGGHLYVVEFADGPPSEAALARFASTLDTFLCARNEDYAAHRAGGFGMTAPAVLAMGRGGFAAWMKTRGRLGGQHKVPRVINDPETFAELRHHAAVYQGEAG